MASPTSPQHEPTMEEILASIRKIISEDSSEPQPAQPQVAQPQPMQPPVSELHEADVLELTHEVEEEPNSGTGGTRPGNGSCPATTSAARTGSSR